MGMEQSVRHRLPLRQPVDQPPDQVVGRDVLCVRRDGDLASDMKRPDEAIFIVPPRDHQEGVRLLGVALGHNGFAGDPLGDLGMCQVNGEIR